MISKKLRKLAGLFCFFEAVKYIFKLYKLTWLLYLVLFLYALYIQWHFTQLSISIAVNGIWNRFFDFLFTYLTYLGDGYFALILGVIVLTQNRKLGWGILLSYAISALTAQGLKHLVFEEMNRPSWVYKDQPFHFVEGVEVFAFNSFPSGHSTTAFALAIILSLYFNKLPYSLMFLTLAIGVAMSRIYLVEHFFQDTLAGSVIGFVVASLVYFIINKNELLKHEPLPI